ncbi:hypothetical protein FRACA_10116 [Frankia canadensis]|uniref:Uncharacterized protein n=1 Tax=Frankia canadensis TaxID=1836972 RepID=A0A2I2KI62_9ACTN|nr:hypothetical protein FRACA_10116 [Frankia canadensis]SOU52647.1 hypothetical protein FRACA_10116 [Frankia canadensis]
MPLHGAAQRLVLRRVHGLDEVQQRQAPVLGPREHLAHHPGRVRAAAQRRLIEIRPPRPLPGQPALAVQPVHHGHHRRVGQRPVEQPPDVPHGHRLPGRPHPIHDLGLQITELFHHARSSPVRTSHPTRTAAIRYADARARTRKRNPHRLHDRRANALSVSGTWRYRLGEGHRPTPQPHGRRSGGARCATRPETASSRAAHSHPICYMT